MAEMETTKNQPQIPIDYNYPSLNRKDRMSLSTLTSRENIRQKPMITPRLSSEKARHSVRVPLVHLQKKQHMVLC